MNAPDPPVLKASLRAILAGAFAAALEVAVFGALAGGGGDAFSLFLFAATFAVALVLAALHLLLLGLPFYLVLRRFVRVGVLASALCGFLVGALPWTILLASPRFEPLSILMWGVPGLAAGLAFGLRLRRHERETSVLSRAVVFE